MATLVPHFAGAEIFHEMSAKLYGRLDSSSLTNVWRGLRAELFPKLFGKHYQVIRSTTDAPFYRPFSVYTADPKSCNSPCCKNPPKNYLANFKEMIHVEQRKRDVMHEAFTVQEDHRFPVIKCCHFHLYGVRNNKSGVKVRKEIVVQLNGVRKYYTCLPLLHQGDIRLDPKYKRAGLRMHVVHEVFAVDQMWISTHGDIEGFQEKRTWEFQGTMPIAVRYREFNDDFFTAK